MNSSIFQKMVRQLFAFAAINRFFSFFNFSPVKDNSATGNFFAEMVFFVSGADVKPDGFPAAEFIGRLEKTKEFFEKFFARFFADGLKGSFRVFIFPTFDGGFDTETKTRFEEFFGNFFAQAGFANFEFNFVSFDDNFGGANFSDFSPREKFSSFDINGEFTFGEFNFENEFSFFFADGESEFAFPFNSTGFNSALEAAQ